MAYASIDLSSKPYDDRIFYNNHRYKRSNRPQYKDSYTLHGYDTKGTLGAPRKDVKDHSVAPYAYVGVKKMFEDYPNYHVDGVKFEPTKEEIRNKRLEAQQHNKEGYMYRKYLKNRYQSM